MPFGPNANRGPTEAQLQRQREQRQQIETGFAADLRAGRAISKPDSATASFYTIGDEEGSNRSGLKSLAVDAQGALDAAVKTVGEETRLGLAQKRDPKTKGAQLKQNIATLQRVSSGETPFSNVLRGGSKNQARQKRRRAFVASKFFDPLFDN